MSKYRILFECLYLMFSIELDIYHSMPKSRKQYYTCKILKNFQYKLYNVEKSKTRGLNIVDPHETSHLSSGSTAYANSAFLCLALYLLINRYSLITTLDGSKIRRVYLEACKRLIRL